LHCCNVLKKPDDDNTLILSRRTPLVPYLAYPLQPIVRYLRGGFLIGSDKTRNGGVADSDRGTFLGRFRFGKRCLAGLVGEGTPETDKIAGETKEERHFS
jgi:hypothetical protein